MRERENSTIDGSAFPPREEGAPGREIVFLCFEVFCKREREREGRKNHSPIFENLLSRLLTSLERDRDSAILLLSLSRPVSTLTRSNQSPKKPLLERRGC